MQAFFQRWWNEQSEEIKRIVKELIHSGQLELMYLFCQLALSVSHLSLCLSVELYLTLLQKWWYVYA